MPKKIVDLGDFLYFIKIENQSEDFNFVRYMQSIVEYVQNCPDAPSVEKPKSHKKGKGIALVTQTERDMVSDLLTSKS